MCRLCCGKKALGARSWENIGLNQNQWTTRILMLLALQCFEASRCVHGVYACMLLYRVDGVVYSTIYDGALLLCHTLLINEPHSAEVRLWYGAMLRFWFRVDWWQR